MQYIPEISMKILALVAIVLGFVPWLLLVAYELLEKHDVE